MKTLRKRKLFIVCLIAALFVFIAGALNLVTLTAYALEDGAIREGYDKRGQMGTGGFVA